MSDMGIFQQLAVPDILAPSEQSEPNVSHHQVTCASQNGGVPGWCASDCDYRPRSDRVRSSHNGFAGRLPDGGSVCGQRDSRRLSVQLAVPTHAEGWTSRDVLNWHLVSGLGRNPIATPVGHLSGESIACNRDLTLTTVPVLRVLRLDILSANDAHKYQ